jgi:hypothetical protein
LLDEAELKNFGFLYNNDDKYSFYKFVFEVQHDSVFENGIRELGALYNDCEGVPMISCDDQITLEPTLNITTELQNIYFESVRYE